MNEVFTIIGLVSCVVWAYVLVAVAMYFMIRPFVYEIERLQYAACWQFVPLMLMQRTIRLRRRQREMPPILTARSERGRQSARHRL